MDRNVFNNKTKKILKPRKGGCERLMINNWLIHRLVALTFLENPYNYPIIDHIDRNFLNNNINV